MLRYSISDPDKPWIVLFSSPHLGAIAEALVAQPQIPTSTMCATLDGKPRALSSAERMELSEHVRELNPMTQRRPSGQPPPTKVTQP